MRLFIGSRSARRISPNRSVRRSRGISSSGRRSSCEGVGTGHGVRACLAIVSWKGVENLVRPGLPSGGNGPRAEPEAGRSVGHSSVEPQNPFPMELSRGALSARRPALAGPMWSSSGPSLTQADAVFLFLEILGFCEGVVCGGRPMIRRDKLQGMIRGFAVDGRMWSGGGRFSCRGGNMFSWTKSFRGRPIRRDWLRGMIRGLAVVVDHLLRQTTARPRIVLVVETKRGSSRHENQECPDLLVETSSWNSVKDPGDPRSGSIMIGTERTE